MRQKVTIREVSIGDKTIAKNINVNGRTKAKVIDKFLWFWIKPIDIHSDRIQVRHDVFEEALTLGPLTVVFKYETEEGKSLLRVDVATMRRYSKKFEKRDPNNPRVMIKWMEIHLKHLKVVHGKPLWKEDPLQTNL